MGIELGSIGSAIGSVASSVGRAGAGVAEKAGGVTPAMGISGSGIAKGFALEGFKPMGLADIAVPDLGGVFKPAAELGQTKPMGNLNPIKRAAVVAGPEKITGAAYWFSNVPGLRVIKPAEVIMPRVEPMIAPLKAPSIIEFPKPSIVISPALEPATKIENRISVQTAPKVSPLPKEEVEEIVEKKETLDQQDQEDENEIRDSEDFSESKIKFVEAVKISNERRKKIEKAVERAGAENITVVEVLPAGFWDDKSPIVGDGKDWTIDLTVQALRINPNNYRSIEQAKKASVISVAENIPIEKGEGGRIATVEEVRKVIHGQKDWLVSKTPAEIVERRVVKKRIEVAKTGEMLKVLENKVETIPETTLKDLNLEKLFPKTA